MFKTECIVDEFYELQVKICLSWEVQKVDKVGSGAGNHAFFPDPDSVADSGCFFPDPGTDFFPSRIRDTQLWIRIRAVIKNNYQY